MSTVNIAALRESLEALFQDADEIWIAVALINDDGYATIQRHLPKGVKQNYLLGIDLPTSVDVLRTIRNELADGIVEAAIYQQKDDSSSYHPKLYLARRGLLLQAVLGSANLTSGGLFKNTELNIRTDDQSLCTELKTWFEGHFTDGFPLTEANISSYAQRYENLVKQPRPPKVKLVKPRAATGTFAQIDFNDRYFKKEHHEAFRRDAWNDPSKSADADRKNAMERFKELHEQLFPLFKANGLGALYPNVPQHLVSMYHHVPERTQQALDAMWLSYGKSEDEIKAYHKELRLPRALQQDQENDLQSFINHARLQIRIEYQQIGIWILFAKNNGGGLFDRNAFAENMRRGIYRSQFFSLLKDLPYPYWISVGGRKEFVRDFPDETTLHMFCKNDKPNHYFTIGRNYNITDPEMSESALPGEVIQEFKRLHPLYRFMRHYLPK